MLPIPSQNDYWLTHGRVPVCLLAPELQSQFPPDDLSQRLGEGWAEVHIAIQGGQLRTIVPATQAPSPQEPQVNLRQGLVWPCFVDAHTHLDKGHIWHRAPNPNGTFMTALDEVEQDRQGFWRAEDLYQRMEFGLRCSYAHGTRAIRTHLDTFAEQTEVSLEVFQALRQTWKDRIELQAVGLVSLDCFMTPAGEKLADQLAEMGGVLGGVTLPSPDLQEQVDRVFAIANDHHLPLDLHTDESLNPQDMALRLIAQAKLRHDFPLPVICDHCCSLSVQPDDVVQETLHWVQQAGLGLISLPLCNLYLQDRQPQRTPRYRGVTLLHELRQRHIPVVLASDNCRDPFFAYGDHDLLEIFTQSVRIGHLDRPFSDWPTTVTTTPARLMELSHPGWLEPGQPADLILFKARTFNELLSRPQEDRVVLRQGQAIDTTLPDYAELDDLLLGKA